MKHTLSVLILSIAASFASTGVFAQTPSPSGVDPQRMELMMQQLEARFASANTTHDGKLTKAQAAQGMPMVARNFERIDSQQAGYVTLPQIRQYMEQRAASH